MWATIKAAAGFLSGFVNLLLGRQRRKEREAAEDTGRKKQRQESAEAQLKQSRKARENVEDVGRLPDDALDSELRKVARPENDK